MPKKKNNKFWQFKNAGKGTGELMLYGDIASSTWWGDEVTPQQFKEELDGLGDISQLNVYINSNGGDIFAGQAIYSMIKRHQANVTVYVDGLAASIASVIAMAGDKIIMPKGSMLMIHNGMVGLMGFLNAAKLREYADMIEKITSSVVLPAYERSALTQEEIQSMLDAETWLSAQEAVDYGFADEIEEGKQVAASISGNMLTINGLDVDLNNVKNVPRGFLALANKPELVPPEETPEPDETDETEKAKAILALELDL